MKRKKNIACRDIVNNFCSFFFSFSPDFCFYFLLFYSKFKVRKFIYFRLNQINKHRLIVIRHKRTELTCCWIKVAKPTKKTYYCLYFTLRMKKKKIGKKSRSTIYLCTCYILLSFKYSYVGSFRLFTN